MKRIIKNNYKLILFCLVIAIIGHFYFLKNQILNNQYMIGPYDQFTQMIIFKDLLYDEFSSGNFFYSFNFNGGANAFTRLSYYFSTSLVFYLTVLITYVLEVLNIISSTSIVYWASAAVFISIARTFVILLVTTKYINLFVHNKRISLLGSTFYALSSIYFRHATLWEFFGDAMIWLPIILLGVENIIRKKDGKVFTIGVALTLFNNGYFAFANLLFTLVYIVLRFIITLSDNEENWLSQVKYYSIYGLLGVGLSLPGFIPFVIGFFSTSRLSPEFSIPTMEFLEFNLGDLLLKDQIQLLPILFIVVISYFSNYKSKKFKFFSFLSFLLILLRYNPLVASLFNGLSYPQYRWHYITFLIIAVTIALGIKNILFELNSEPKRSLVFLAVSAAITMSSYYIANQQLDEHYFDMKIIYLVIAVFYLGFLLVNVKRVDMANGILPLLFVASLYTVFVSNRQLYYEYNLFTMDYDEIYNTFDNPNTDFEKALDVIEEESDRFYRVDFRDMHNLGSQKEFSSFNVYSSFQNRYQQYFYRYFQIINSRENNGIIDGLAGRQNLSSMFQSDYVIASEADQYIIPTGFEAIETIGDLKVFENQIPLAFIHPVHELYSMDDVTKNDYKDDLIINGAIVPDEFSNTKFESTDNKSDSIEYTITEVGTEVEGNTLLESDQEFSVEIDLQANTAEYEDLVIDYTIKPSDSGETGRYTYFINDYSIQLKSTGDPYSSQLYRHQAHIPYTDEITFTLAPETNYTFEIHDIYGVSHEKLVDRSQDDAELEYDVQIGEGEIAIQFNNEEDFPLMVLPLFYEPGWKLQINGEDQEVINVNNGMIGFEIPEDELMIELKFTQPFLGETWGIALLSFLGLIYVDRNRKKRSQAEIF